MTNPPCADCGMPARGDDGYTFTRLNETRGRVQLVLCCRECAGRRDAAKGAK